MLTMPNKMIGIDSKPYISAYEELSKKYPMIDTRDIFSSGDFSLYRSDDATEYGKDIRIHLSSKGQTLISSYILSKILPKDWYQAKIRVFLIFVLKTSQPPKKNQILDNPHPHYTHESYHVLNQVYLKRI